jgi:hypothetical protein
MENNYLILRKGKYWDHASPVIFLSNKNPSKDLVKKGSKVIIEKELSGEIKYLGYAEVESVKEINPRDAEFPNHQWNIYFKNDIKFYPARVKNSEIRKLLNTLPNYRWTDSIRPLTKDVFERIIKFCFDENWRLFLDEIPSVHSQYITLDQLLLEDESEILEYKTSMLTSTQPPQELIRLKDSLKKTNENNDDIYRQINKIETEQKKNIQEEIIKAIVAFLNSNGGTLIVGVDDNKNLIGIENDYQRLSKKKDWDGWVLELRNLLDKYIDDSIISQLHLTQILKNGKTIARIDVPSSPKPIYMKYEKDEKLFIRRLNSSEKLSNRQSNEYIKERWKNY